MLKFGTSGARGLVSEMTDLECYLFTTAFLSYLKKKNLLKREQSVAIAGDFRPSTKGIMQAVSAAIEDFSDFDCQTINCGIIPTPAVSFFAFQRKIPSIMVTGSHIPYDRNGIKFNMPEGEILKKDEKEIVEEYQKIEKEGNFKEKFNENGSLKNLPELPAVEPLAKEEYVKRYLDFFPKNCLANKTIVYYQHSSVARDIIPEVLEKLGAKVKRVAKTEDFVPIDTEVVRDEDFELAAKWAKEFAPDAIMSADGDGDRPMLFDENGKFIRGDILGVLCSWFLRADSVSVTVSSNTALEKIKQFGKINRTKIGSPYVIEGMNEDLALGKKRVVSYEANGGFLTGSELEINEKILKPLPTRDTILPLISALLLANQENTSLSGLTEKLPERLVYSTSIKGIPTEKSLEFLEIISKDKSPEEVKELLDLPSEIIEINTTDGTRMYLDNKEIVHLRPSSNSPEFRCYSETTSFERSKELTNKILETIRNLDFFKET